jgi:hypothetical protein
LEENKKHIRTFCKGWGNNVRGQLRKDKQSLMEELKLIDVQAEDDILNTTQWKDRYAKEKGFGANLCLQGDTMAEKGR